MEQLKKRIIDKNITIGVVGLGYVGLPLAVEFASRGIRTIGIDVDRTKVESVNKGKNYIGDIEDKVLAGAVNSGTLSAENNYGSVGKCDAIFICVPTPFTPNKEPDITFIVEASKEIAKGLRKDQIIVLRSTTFPNTTEGYVQPILEKTGLKAGSDFFLAFSPERIDPGNKSFKTNNIPTVVGGVNETSTDLAAAVIQHSVSQVVKVSNPKVAEMEKLLENIFRSVNIALVNELAQLCDRMGGINIWEVVEAAATKPFGFMPFFPGPGIGGHCILIDPYYLEWLAKAYDFQTNFISLAAEVNENMPFYVRNMVQRELSFKPISFREAKIVILGVAFKRDVDDTRHSPALKVMELLLQDGAANIFYNDPYVPEVRVDGKDFKSIEITRDVLKSADCVLITTDHSSYDYSFVVENAATVIDARNATKNVKKGREKIVLLGDGK
ncbi:MAG: nucleotide sugar dehydrogenase [Bacteroidetes bacterium]|jgi:UDP-N-acetyl-D-glucosamine dehydrogenase|nr:nucleotide sugar dehydrogenase [Bacteroidota bacterium]MCL5035206.1 nucleotide sugar dehydrogenase [Bacteroidota bacterium]